MEFLKIANLLLKELDPIPLLLIQPSGDREEQHSHRNSQHGCQSSVPEPLNLGSNRANRHTPIPLSRKHLWFGGQLAQDAILLLQIVNNGQLMLIHPAGQRNQQQLLWKHVHGGDRITVSGTGIGHNIAIPRHPKPPRCKDLQVG